MKDDPNEALRGALSGPESKRFDVKAERRVSMVVRQSASDGSARFRKGDIGGTQGTAWLSRAIRWATRQHWEPKSLVNHTLLVVNDCDRIEDVEVVEALGRVRHHKLVDRYAGRGKVELWRPLNVDDEQRDRIVARIMEHVGNWYPWHRLIFHFIDERLFGGRMVARRLACVKSWGVCTPMVMLAYWPEDLHFGLESPFQGNPDNLRDFLAENPEKYLNHFKLQHIPRKGCE